LFVGGARYIPGSGSSSGHDNLPSTNGGGAVDPFTGQWLAATMPHNTDDAMMIMIIYDNVYLLTELEGRTGQYLAQGDAEIQIFSCTARPNSVNKHFIIWPNQKIN